METEAKKKLLTRIRDRAKVMREADQENRRLAIEDMEFAVVPGSQWDENMKKERGDRPCYEFNRIRINGKKIINEIRSNRPAGKVRGVESGDKDTAETIEGLIRNICNTSDIDTIVDYEAEYLVYGGMCGWRVTTDYASDHAFDQDIKVEVIENPFCLYSDPACKDPLKRDAEDWLLTERITNSEFESRWPKAEKVEWESSEFDDEEEWQSDETTRIAEYWWKEFVDKEIWLLEDGKVIDAESEEAGLIDQALVTRRRTVKANKIMMCIASGDAILEGPVDWAGKQHPFVQIYGEYIVVDGKKYWYGLPRWSRDAQQSYNVSRTAITETIAQAPQAKWWATPEQAKGHTNTWAEAHQKNFPFLLANPDPNMPGFPQRMGGADVPVALIQESQLASKEIDDVTGIYADDRGQDSSSQSGRAIYARQQQGRISTFNYPDNVGKGIQRTWEILIDLIPNIYDTERELRILGNDGSENYVRVNTFEQNERGEMIKVKDLSQGRFDVTVTVGPSFSTRRQEAAETYQQLIQANPAIFPVAGDLIFRSMDLPFSEDIAERLKVLLPPEVQQMIQEDAEIPPEAQAVMQQANQAMQMVQQEMQTVQQAAQEVMAEKQGIDKEAAAVEKGKAEVQTLIANLKTEEARFEAKIAKELAKIAEKGATVQMDELRFDSAIKQKVIEEQDQLNAERETVESQVNNAINVINQIAGEFMMQAQQAMEEIREKAESRPKVVRVESRRENGKLVAVPVYEEDME